MPSPQPRRDKKRRQNTRRVALVTGGAVRLGRAIALALADAGMDVAIAFHRSTRDAKRTVGALQARGVRAVALRADVSDPAQARDLVPRAVAALGRLDVLVNSAAVFRRTPLESVTAQTYDEFLDVNLRAAFFCGQAAARAMGRRGGHIVNIGDAAVARPWPSALPYAASKAGLAALTLGLAAALRSRGITVNEVAPGPVLRPRGFPLARWRRLTRGRPVPVERVTAAVVAFATGPKTVTGRRRKVERPG